MIILNIIDKQVFKINKYKQFFFLSGEQRGKRTNFGFQECDILSFSSHCSFLNQIIMLNLEKRYTVGFRFRYPENV